VHQLVIKRFQYVNILFKIFEKLLLDQYIGVKQIKINTAQ